MSTFCRVKALWSIWNISPVPYPSFQIICVFLEEYIYAVPPRGLFSMKRGIEESWDSFSRSGQIKAQKLNYLLLIIKEVSGIKSISWSLPYFVRPSKGNVLRWNEISILQACANTTVCSIHSWIYFPGFYLKSSIFVERWRSSCLTPCMSPAAHTLLYPFVEPTAWV